MTNNEKAEAYDKALERARAINNGKDVDVESGTTICEYIFPELKESEDDKIKKEIISILRNTYWTSNRNRFNELVAWLEKQGFALDNHQFINVTDGLPKQDEEVVVLCDELNTAPCYKIAFGHIVDKTICKDYNGWNISNVVYWFPMPKLPKE